MYVVSLLLLLLLNIGRGVNSAEIGTALKGCYSYDRGSFICRPDGDKISNLIRCCGVYGKQYCCETADDHPGNTGPNIYDNDVPFDRAKRSPKGGSSGGGKGSGGKGGKTYHGGSSIGSSYYGSRHGVGNTSIFDKILIGLIAILIALLIMYYCIFRKLKRAGIFPYRYPSSTAAEAADHEKMLDGCQSNSKIDSKQLNNYESTYNDFAKPGVPGTPTTQLYQFPSRSPGEAAILGSDVNSVPSAPSCPAGTYPQPTPAAAQYGFRFTE